MKVNKMNLAKKIFGLTPDQTELTLNELKDLLNELNDSFNECSPKIEKKEINDSPSPFKKLNRFSRPETKAEDNLKAKKKEISNSPNSSVLVDDPNLPPFARVAFGMDTPQVCPKVPEDVELSEIDKMLLTRLLYRPILIKYIPKILEDYGEIQYLKDIKEILEHKGLWDIKESLGQSYVLSLIEFVRRSASSEKFEEFLFNQVFSHIVHFEEDGQSSYCIRHWDSISISDYKIDRDKYCRDFPEDIASLKEFQDRVSEDIAIYGNVYNAFKKDFNATFHRKLHKVVKRCIEFIDGLDSWSNDASFNPNYPVRSKDVVRIVCYDMLRSHIAKLHKCGLPIPKYLDELYKSSNGYKNLDLEKFYRAIYYLN